MERRGGGWPQGREEEEGAGVDGGSACSVGSRCDG